MRVPNFFNDRLPSRIPAFLRHPRALFQRVERGVTWMAGSKWNPLHHSGAIAGTLILILILTGIPLLFYYRLGAPYTSLQEFNSSLNFGSILRSIHRYATDLTLIAVGLHVLKIIIQGKTWGPRTLAWVTGVLLLLLFFISSYSGFILVWDRFALQVARSAAEAVDLLPFLPTPASRNFSGDVPLGTSFFFMNLFLHVAIPLGMFAALAVHVSRVKKPMWMLKGAPLAGIVLGLTALALLFPLALDQPADLLSLDPSFKSDAFFSPWLIIQRVLGVKTSVALLLLAFVAFIAIPWIWRPKQDALPPKSIVDEKHCEGCSQCVQDCPFDAIEMRPRSLGEGSPLVAHVLSDLCVSCGICSGSCNQFSVGPEPWRGRQQLQSASALFGAPRLALALCANRKAPKLSAEWSIVKIECVGILHASTFTRMLQHYTKILVWGCEDGECGSRYGGRILRERLDGTRTPTLPSRVSRDSIQWLGSHLSESEVVREITRNSATQVAGEVRAASKFGILLKISLIFLFALSAYALPVLTAFSIGPVLTDDSALRLAWRTPSVRRSVCRDRSDAELQALPIHMRTAKICSEENVDLLLTVSIDGKIAHEERFAAKGFRSDRPVVVDKTISIPPGFHQVRVSWNAADEAKAESSFEADFERARARLISRDPHQNVFQFL